MKKFAWQLLKAYLTLSFYFSDVLNTIFSRLLFSMIIPFFKKIYHIAILNIIMCFKKSISPRQRKALAKHSLVFSLFSIRTIFSILENKKSLSSLKIRFINKEYLDGALIGKGSALIVTGHLGIFPLIPLYLAKNNYKIDVVIKPPHDIEFQEYVFHHMKKNNIGIIPATPETTCYRLMCSALQQNRLVMVMIDQTPTQHQSKAITKFFDWDTLVYPTIATLSQKYEAPIIPVFTFYDNEVKDSPYIIKAYKPLYVHENEDAISHVNSILEESILKYPWQWWWFHKRWYNLIDYSNNYYYEYAIREPDKFFDFISEHKE